MFDRIDRIYRKKYVKNHLDSPLFWDVDKTKLDKSIHKAFIIERVLQYGLPEDVLWLLNTYSEDDLIAVVKKSKNVDRKTANFWTIHLNINRDEVLCLNRPLIHKQFY